MVTCPVNSTVGNICEILNEVGLGLSALFTGLLQGLPAFLLIIAIIGSVVMIMSSVGKVITSAIGKRK